MKRTILAGLVLLLPLVATGAWAASPDDAACCVQSTSWLDAQINPATGGDERFFTVSGVVPNVVFTLDASGSMDWYPNGGTPGDCTSNNECHTCNDGCGCFGETGYDPETEYLPEIASFDSTSGHTRLDGQDERKGWFLSNTVYQLKTGTGYGIYDSDDPKDPNSETWEGASRGEAITSACMFEPDTEVVCSDDSDCGAQESCRAVKRCFDRNDAYRQTTKYCSNDNQCGVGGDCKNFRCHVPDADEDTGRSCSRNNDCKSGENCITVGHCFKKVLELSTACKTCLETEGYFHDRAEPSKSRAVGNFLNAYAPRFIMVRRVIKEVLASSKPIRLAGVRFYSGSPGRFQSFSPDCDEVSGLANPATWDTHRNTFAQAVERNVRPSGGTPLMRSLLLSGFMFGGPNANARFVDLFGPDWRTTTGVSKDAVSENGFKEQEPVCDGCSAFNAIVLLTDGVGNSQENSLRDQLSELPCPGCQDSSLDEVARAFYTGNLSDSNSNPRHVSTYTIGFGLNREEPTVRKAALVLENAALVGGGLALSASNGAELAKAFQTIFDDIAKRSSAFASSSVSSMQTGTEQLTALMPRMMPNRDGPWTGRLYRFGLYNEFVEGGTTDPTKLHPQRSPSDPIPSIFIVDKQNNIVEEDTASGKFKRRASGNRAEEYWEANEKLVELGHQNRKIFTVIDCSGEGCEKDGLFTENDQVIEFSDSNIDKLIDYLGIRGVSGFCPTQTNTGDLLAFLKLPSANVAASAVNLTWPSNPGPSDYEKLCGRLLINYVRGQDLAGEVDLTRKATRREVLGDIFHSSPTIVEPPAEPWLCDLGLSNQCLRTLYSKHLATTPTPQASAKPGPNCDGTGSVDRTPYEQFAWEQGTRKKLALVGANDGMLHAFVAGEPTVTCEGNERIVTFNEGSGQEAWAFIPPDLLPRLKDLVYGHTYLVDGDVMVRDIWADDDFDGVKEPGEFHTVAVVAEGRGGTHYFALDLTEDYTSKSDRTGFFRWIFPQPCSAEAARFGKTLLALAPRPPPIGPVLLEVDAGANNKVMRYSKPTEERWVAMLSGGWSPNGEKGRGIYMVDVWRGKLDARGEKDNLVWKLEQPANNPSLDDQQSPTQHLTQSIVAPVSMVDYGSNTSPQLDGFFDTGVVGDTRGQIWVARFYAPGKVGSDGLVTNWAAGRAFAQDDSTLSAADDEDATGQSIVNVNPFFSLASVGLQLDNNALRVFLGTGNRYSLLDPDGGYCRFDNPLACAKYGCDVAATYSVSRWATDLSLDAEWEDKEFVQGGFASTTASGAPQACGTVTAAISSHTLSCPKSGGTVEFIDMPQTRVRCELSGGTSPAYRCVRTDPIRPFYGDENPNFMAASSGLGKNRFYGIWAYGGDRIFDETKTSTGENHKTAAEFDAARLTDRKAANSNGDLVDVTCSAAVTLPASCTTATTPAPKDSRGWFFEYDKLSEKTAGGGALLSSCVMWNSASPDRTENTANSCTAAGAAARLYQADYVTGAAECAEGMRRYDANGAYVGSARYVERAVISPPPEPATVVAISKTDRKVKISNLTLEPGSNVQETSVSITTDTLQSVYELPVSRSLHYCRHHGADRCAVSLP